MRQLVTSQRDDPPACETLRLLYNRGRMQTRIGRKHMSAAACAIGIIMGSQSDWETMQHAAETLDRLGIGYEARIASAHRTPDRVQRYAGAAQARGVKVIIAAAGGAAALAGVIAALTP